MKPGIGKKGFKNPVEDWLQTEMQTFLEECLLQSDLAATLFFDQKHTPQILEPDGNAEDRFHSQFTLAFISTEEPCIHTGLAFIGPKVFMDLSIIIVNWNSKEYLRKCIASILATTFAIEFEILVIDNGSFEGSGEMLQQYYPQVRFIQSNRNLGFAKANNVAFRESRGRFILFLNPDTELVSPVVKIMFDYLERLPKAGAIGCKLLNADGSTQTSCIQSFPTIVSQILGSEFFITLFPKSRLWGMATLFGTENGPAEVEALSGACIMLSRKVFEQVGLFSEDYFMYAEDVDLCYNVKRAGYKNYYIPQATVVHYGGGSTQQRPNVLSIIMMRESIWRFLRKTRGEIYGLGYRYSMLISAIGRIACLLILLPLYISRRRRESWKTSVKKWCVILTWSLGIKDVEEGSHEKIHKYPSN